MKIKHIVLTASILVSVSAFAQKDELKSLKRIYDKETQSASDFQEFKANLSKLEALPLDEGQKVYLKYYKGILPQIELGALGREPMPADLQKVFSSKAIGDMVDGYVSMLEYEKTTGKKVFTDDINEDIAAMKPMMVSGAIALGNAKRGKEAGDILYAVYKLDKKDQDKLFYAASYAVNAEDYDKALQYYYELKQLKYTGEGTVYLAVNKASGQEETFSTKLQREQYMKTGTHDKPRDEKLVPKTGEIYKNIALILVQQGKTAEAKAAIAEARKANPDDTSLLFTELDLYRKLKDFDTYTRLVNEGLEKNPTNTDLLFSLAVVSADSGKLEDAEKYYKKIIEIDPKYFNAYLNLSELKLRADVKYVEEMSKLGMSEKENKRFDQLKALQLKNYKEILPYLEKAVELDDTNAAAKETLLGVYKALEMTDKAKALKAKM